MHSPFLKGAEDFLALIRRQNMTSEAGIYLLTHADKAGFFSTHRPMRGNWNL
jgi:hypothetical protein